MGGISHQNIKQTELLVRVSASLSVWGRSGKFPLLGRDKVLLFPGRREARMTAALPRAGSKAGRQPALWKARWG